jgi:malic enzyme
MLNRGTAFTLAERQALGLTGLLPDGVSTIEGQLARVYARYRRQPDDLAKNLYLASLRDRNEVLFYWLLTEHIAEMLPIVYTPTVGTAIERYSLEYGRPRGVYLPVDHPDQVETAFRNYGRGPDEVDLIVATDSEGLLGIGDWGVGGIAIAVGKLALYVAAAGLHPRRIIPVVLDAGTDNQALLDDPMYLGNRHPRMRGERYVSARPRSWPAAAPTMLIGTSTQPGVFAEPIITEMAAHTARPVIMPLSNPTSHSEAKPADLITWTGGRALIATGSPFPPVTYDGVDYQIARQTTRSSSPASASGSPSPGPAGSATGYWPPPPAWPACPAPPRRARRCCPWSPACAPYPPRSRSRSPGPHKPRASPRPRWTTRPDR